MVELIVAGLNGMEVIERIRRDFPPTRIVAITGGACFEAIPNQLEALRSLVKLVRMPC